MCRTRALVAGGIGALALLIGGVSPAAADTSGNTVATFTLAAGTIDIGVQPNAALTNGNAGDTLVTGNLGDVTVTDGRGNLLGWTTSAASTTFTGNTGTTSLGVLYDSGAITKTGVVTVVGTPKPLTALAVPVVVGTVVTGNNTATWNPGLTVTLPPTSLAGNYSGTITTSVV